MSAESERVLIADRCPSCGNSTLFIGTGGWLTCSFIGCKEPSVGRALAAEIAERKRLEAENERLTGVIGQLEARVEALVRAVAYAESQFHMMREGGPDDYSEALAKLAALAAAEDK